MTQIKALLFALAMALFVKPLCAQAVGAVARGEPYDGMIFGKVLYSDTRAKFIALDSPKIASPVPASQENIVQAITTIFKTRKVSGDTSLKVGATYSTCGSFDLPCANGTMQTLSDVFDKLPDADEYTPTGAYRLPNGRVRIEWKTGLETWYITVLTFEGVKLADITTVPSVMLVKLNG